jgi:beta-lactamase regulating signal transducer with metallopeptidase domain
MIFSQAGEYVTIEDNSTTTPNIDNLLLLPGEMQEQADENALAPSLPVKSIWKTLMSWLWLAWLAPAALLLLRKVTSYHRHARFVKSECSLIADAPIRNFYRETCETMGIKHPPDLAKNELVAAPMLVRIIRPVIVLPDTKLKNAEMQYVLRHELTHHKRRDIFYKWLVQIVLCLHWFNPVVYWINRQVNRNCELSCDEAVIRRLDSSSKFAYGDMLLGARAIAYETCSEIEKIEHS